MVHSIGLREGDDQRVRTYGRSGRRGVFLSRYANLRMNELAALVGVSEKYFISYFKKSVGITPDSTFPKSK